MVKTRLAHHIGDDRTLEIYLALLQDTITAADTAASDTILSIYRENIGSTDLDEPFRDKHRILQKGNDLGDRQFNSLTATYDLGYKRAIVIAGDSPEISATTIDQAFYHMDETDAVIGPCHDGGYYLLGVRPSKLSPEIFLNISWGEETVSKELTRNLERLGLTFIELDPLYDVDTVEDLELFVARNAVLDAPITHQVVTGLVSALMEKGCVDFE